MIVRTGFLDSMESDRPLERANGRMSGRMDTRQAKQRQNNIGPAGFGLKPAEPDKNEG
jgi:hypothetical protein